MPRIARAASPAYLRRDPEATALHGVVREHLTTFLDRCRERADGRDLPAFVTRAFRRYLDCGLPQKAFCASTATAAASITWSPSRARAAASTPRAAADA